MEINLKTAMTGRGTVIKNKIYYSTEAYITPFLERMSQYTDEFIVNVKLPDQMSITKEDDLSLTDTVFNRVWIQAILPDSMNFPNHKEAIHLLYALDTKKPLVKIARTAINGACLNQCIFSPTFLNVQALEPETPIDYSFITPLMEQTSDMGDKLRALTNREIPYNGRMISETLGDWVRNTLKMSINSEFGKVKLATSSAVTAYKSLYEDQDSPYYVKPGDSTSGFNVYNAWTQVITDDKKDIVNKLEKTLLLLKVLDVF